MWIRFGLFTVNIALIFRLLTLKKRMLVVDQWILLIFKCRWSSKKINWCTHLGWVWLGLLRHTRNCVKVSKESLDCLLIFTLYEIAYNEIFWYFKPKWGILNALSFLYDQLITGDIFLSTTSPELFHWWWFFPTNK